MWIYFIRDIALESKLHQNYQKMLDEKLKTENETLQVRKTLQKLEITVESQAKVLQIIAGKIQSEFMLFDKPGICVESYFQTDPNLFENKILGQPIEMLLKVSRSDEAKFEVWYQSLFGNQLRIQELVNLGPQFTANETGKIINSEYFPIRQGKTIVNILIVATRKLQQN